jgi:hypothetical protein
MTTHRKKLIEVVLINAASAREKSISKGHPWQRR